MSDWVAKHLSKSWEEVGGCWGLYRTCVREQIGFSLPEYPAVSIEDVKYMIGVIKEQVDAKHPWTETDEPKEGDCVLMSSVYNVFNHVGYYIEGGLVFHSTRRTGTMVAKISQLSNLGYKEYRFYRHAQFN